MCERKNHLAIARACIEANTMGIDENGTYKKRTVIKNCALWRSAAIRFDPRGERQQKSLNTKWVQIVMCEV